MNETHTAFIPLVFFTVLAILAGGLLSLLKSALACARKPRLRSLIEGGRGEYLAVLEAAEKPAVYLTSLKIGIVFLEILSGALGAYVFSPPLEHTLAASGLPPLPAEILSLLITSLAVMIFLFIVSEVILRRIALAFPETISLTLYPLIRALPVFVYPLLAASRLLSAFMKKILSAEASRHGMTEEELHHALLEGEKSGVVESEERSMVEGVFYLGDRPVSAFMTHRSDIEWLDTAADAETARRTAENAHSQNHFPVSDGDLDEVSGVVLVQDIYRALLQNPWPGLKTVMRTPYYIPETMPALKAFEAFKKADALYLFVMDEYGGFAGILTMRNLVEEIVGGLSATTGTEETIVQQEDGTWLADGGINIDEAANTLGLTQLGNDHPEYHTLAGFILDLSGTIPREGETFTHKGHTFKILDMDNNRIDKILITKQTESEDDAAG